jgi:ubiquinone/menaquinone biosynthesis C-methylase UbiE
VGYDIESYWSRVADEIQSRGNGNSVAGDDNPFLRYKRSKFLRRFLSTLDVSGRTVLEVGCGPGGNLLELAPLKPESLIGVDISAHMLALATKNLDRFSVELMKTDGQNLPLGDRSVDLAYTVTVLQHNVDAAGVARLIGELCRVTADQIVIMEDTGHTATAREDSSFIARPVEAYITGFERLGFQLQSRTYLNLFFSRQAYKVIRRLLVPASHHEGEPFGAVANAVLSLVLVITRVFDDLKSEREDLTKMVFVRR